MVNVNINTIKIIGSNTATNNFLNFATKNLTLTVLEKYEKVENDKLTIFQNSRSDCRSNNYNIRFSSFQKDFWWLI